MYDRHDAIATFCQKAQRILELHELDGLGEISFSKSAVTEAVAGSYEKCVKELQLALHNILGGKLSTSHIFVNSPYVRGITLPGGDLINVAIINQQSLEWYGREEAIGAFDFIYESQRGVFEGCRTFLDLGGHQLVWSIFYAKTSEAAKVLAFEPSVLNAIIGLFNCLINNVIERVEVVPFAVAAEKQASDPTVPLEKEGSKMLVDFMTLPLRTCYLGKFANDVYDFVKTDIEGYEYELLADHKYRALVKSAKVSHYELHLGHLVSRAIEVEDCIAALRDAGFTGKELYSNVDMYDFLSTCKRNGFYSFLIH